MSTFRAIKIKKNPNKIRKLKLYIQKNDIYFLMVKASPAPFPQQQPQSWQTLSSAFCAFFQENKGRGRYYAHSSVPLLNNLTNILVIFAHQHITSETH